MFKKFKTKNIEYNTWPFNNSHIEMKKVRLYNQVKNILNCKKKNSRYC